MNEDRPRNRNFRVKVILRGEYLAEGTAYCDLSRLETRIDKEFAKLIKAVPIGDCGLCSERVGHCYCKVRVRLKVGIIIRTIEIRTARIIGATLVLAQDQSDLIAQFVPPSDSTSEESDVHTETPGSTTEDSNNNSEATESTD